MTHLWLFSAWLALQASGSAPARAKPQPISASATPAMIENILESGRCAQVGESPSSRISARRLIAPGLPPLLSFRYYEGKAHHGFGNTGLVLDDAGH